MLPNQQLRQNLLHQKFAVEEKLRCAIRDNNGMVYVATDASQKTRLVGVNQDGSLTWGATPQNTLTGGAYSEPSCSIDGLCYVGMTKQYAVVDQSGLGKVTNVPNSNGLFTTFAIDQDGFSLSHDGSVFVIDNDQSIVGSFTNNNTANIQPGGYSIEENRGVIVAFPKTSSARGMILSFDGRFRRTMPLAWGPTLSDPNYISDVYPDQIFVLERGSGSLFARGIKIDESVHFNKK